MHDSGHFDETVAATYDEIHGQDDPKQFAQMIDCLDSLSEGGNILEFAVGTGRVALPLVARGRKVKGIELSQPMVAELRKKETHAPIEIAIGDMTNTRVSGKYSLVFLVYNTIDNLTSQEAQIACFQNAADHLRNGGRFIVETLVPPIQDLPFGETKRAFSCEDDHFGIDVFDVTTQNYSSNHVHCINGNFQHFAAPFRYAWPSELDLMARLAGLTLEHRWGDWEQSTFDRHCRKHVSIWSKCSKLW